MLGRDFHNFLFSPAGGLAFFNRSNYAVLQHTTAMGTEIFLGMVSWNKISLCEINIHFKILISSYTDIPLVRLFSKYLASFSTYVW